MMEPIVLPAAPSALLELSFVALALGMAVLFALWTGHRLLAAGWLGVTGAVTAVGWLQAFSPPPPLLVLLLSGAMGVTLLAWRSDWHTRPLAFLVGFQSFRILVELAIHQAVVEGVAPPQMTWSGRNLDVLAGLGALVLAPFAAKLPAWSLFAWNAIGLALLVNVVSVAMLSLPTPFQVFEPDNVWLAFFPFSWLPLVLAMMAWLGHVVIFKRLIEDARS